MTLDILFRSCDRSGLERFLKVPKAELLLGSLHSLVDSLQRAMQEHPELVPHVHVLDDHSAPETLSKIQETLSKLSCEYTIVPMDDTGQAASMQFSCDYARRNCHDLIYFVEDDYLHAPTAIAEMVEAYALFSKNLGRDVIISPCDHVVEYRGNVITPTRVVVGSRRHWRIARGTTSTYLLSGAMFQKHYAIYAKHATYDIDPEVCEDNTINLIYRQEFCFSPLPSLTAHVSNEDLEPPYIDWRGWWQRNRISMSN